VVWSPFGLTVPDTVAPLGEIALAVPVATVGGVFGTGGVPVVLNVASLPVDVPPELIAMIR
jgi:hypothetical protein